MKTKRPRPGVRLYTSLHEPRYQYITAVLGFLSYLLSLSRSLGFDAVTDCSCGFPPDLEVTIVDAGVPMTSAVAEHLPNTVHLTLSLAHEYDGRTAKAHLGSAIAEHLPNTVQLSLSLAPDECDGRNAKAHLG